MIRALDSNESNYAFCIQFLIADSRLYCVVANQLAICMYVCQKYEFIFSHFFSEWYSVLYDWRKLIAVIKSGNFLVKIFHFKFVQGISEKEKLCQSCSNQGFLVCNISSKDETSGTSKKQRGISKQQIFQSWSGRYFLY